VIVISIELARMRGLLTILADETAQAFGAAVRQVRLERGETLEDVATRVPRLYAKYLGEIERGWPHHRSPPHAESRTDST
jgi:hypothetical protein